MGTLFIFNLILLVIIAGVLWCIKKYAKSERSKDIILIVSSLLTVICHCSSLIYHHFADGSAMEYLHNNPNMIMPVYPCNAVMWSCVIYGLIKNKDSKVAKFLSDYIFWFGIVSTLVGMFANIDFIDNPTLANFDVTKGIIAHAMLLFNVLLLVIFGRVNVDVKKNMTHIVISFFIMMILGLYNSLIFRALVSEEMAYKINSMFIIHSPFEGIDFLIYPIIALIAIPIYFGLFVICDRFAHKKGERFCDQIRKNRKSEK